MLNLRILGRLLMGVVLVTIVGNSQAAQAQDDEVVDDDNNARPAPVNAMAAVMIPQAHNFDQMDQWVFGRLGGSAGARSKLDSSLLLRIDDLDRVCRITEAQKNKLRLAGRGDIKRFFDKVEALKRKFQQGQNDPNTNIWQEIQPLQVELNAGLFGDNSIYAKTIRRHLEPRPGGPIREPGPRADERSLSSDRRVVRRPSGQGPGVDRRPAPAIY